MCVSVCARNMAFDFRQFKGVFLLAAIPSAGIIAVNVFVSIYGAHPELGGVFWSELLLMNMFWVSVCRCDKC